MYNVFSGMLKVMDIFQEDGQEIAIQYQLDADYRQLLQEHPIMAVAGEGSDFEKAANLLDWLSNHIVHKGNFANSVPAAASALLTYGLDKGEVHGLNCRALSFALTECLLALGIPARTLYLMPMSPYDFDNHVVCEVWIAALNQWVMLDPTYNAYLSADDKILSVYELRDCLANHKEIMFNNNANYNGAPLDKEEMLAYYAKDLFWFQVSTIQGSNSEQLAENRKITIAPVGFDMQKATLAVIDYRIQQWGSSAAMIEWRKQVEQGAEQIIYKGAEVLNCKPLR